MKYKILTIVVMLITAHGISNADYRMHINLEDTPIKFNNDPIIKLPDADFKASSINIKSGDPVTLFWNAVNTEYVEIVGITTKNKNTNNNIIVNPTTTTTYSLILYGYGIENIAQKNITIEVQYKPVNIKDFSFSRGFISEGENETFTWETENSKLVTLNGISEILTGSKTINFPTPGQYIYNLEAKGFDDVIVKKAKRVTVYTTGKNTSTSFRINGLTDITVNQNEPMIATWLNEPNLTYTLRSYKQGDGAGEQVQSAGGTTIINNNHTKTIMSPNTTGVFNYALNTVNPVGFGRGSNNVIVKVENWVPTSPIYTEWVNNGIVNNCTWTPDKSTVLSGESFTQSANDCDQSQTRTKQDVLIETGSGITKVNGTEIVENKTIKVSSTRSEIGTKISKICKYDVAKSYITTTDDGQLIIYWDNVEIVRLDGNVPYTIGGYKYSTGLFKDSGYSGFNFTWSKFEVCRE